LQGKPICKEIGIKRHAGFDNTIDQANQSEWHPLDGRFGVFFIEALRRFKQELDLDRFEWKDDAATFRTIENARIQ
jgi:hypothetical protein